MILTAGEWAILAAIFFGGLFEPRVSIIFAFMYCAYMALMVGFFP